MELEEVIKCIIDGEAVLFLGAGFSTEATNINNIKMQGAKTLSHELCSEMQVGLNDDLGRVSSAYLGKKDKIEYIAKAQKLISKLQNFFLCNKNGYSSNQQIIALQEWLRVYTTNYDDVIETIYDEKSTSNIVPMTLKNKVEEIIKHKSIIHLNGLVRNLDIDKLDNEFKLTNRSYLVEDFLESDVRGLFNSDIRNARAIVFIGTSLQYDIDIQRVIFSVEDISQKLIFIDKELKFGEEPDLIENNIKEDLGKVYNIGIKGFAEEIARVEKFYIKKQKELIYRSFEKIKNENIIIEKATQKMKWALLSFGKIDKNIVSYHLNDDNYLIRRDIISGVNSNIEKQCKTINIIHGNLGSGKTCVMEYLMCYYSSKYNVFQFNEQYADIEQECLQISKLSGKKIVFIENYNLCLDIIKKLSYVMDDDFNLILSCRTFLNINMIYKLSKILRMKIEDMSEFDVNKLSDKEKPNVVKLLTDMNQFEFKDIGDQKGLKLLNNTCNDSWADTVFYFFQSDLVSNHLNQIFLNIAKNESYLEILLATIINNVVGLSLKYNQILNLLKISELKINISRDENIRELLFLEDGKIEIKSSILSLYLIRSKNLYRNVINVMEKMILNADVLLSEDAETVKHQLISISNISELFYKKIPGYIIDENNNILQNEILEFFDKIQKVKYYMKNQFFWLQYSMACLDVNEYDMAENNFKLAYKYSRENKINSYQIDVQYGRYLLERGIKEEYTVEIFDSFKSVNKLWKGVLNNKDAQRYKVFKQMSIYKEYIEKYAISFNSDEFNKAIKLIESLISVIERGKLKIPNLQNETNEAIAKLKNCINILWDSRKLLLMEKSI